MAVADTAEVPSMKLVVKLEVRVDYQLAEVSSKGESHHLQAALFTHPTTALFQT